MNTGRLVYFIDDFGARTLLKRELPEGAPLNESAFALGGIIVRSEDIENLSASVESLCKQFEVPALHGNTIRVKKGKFAFLKRDAERAKTFMNELEALVVDERITANACVICRPGYRDRYGGENMDASKWEMCRTAFDISVERAAKLARSWDRTLSVVYEKTGKKEDRLLDGYFKSLKMNGTGFDVDNSQGYGPLSSSNFGETLGSIRGDGKNNQMLQIADLVLHPLCHRVSGKKNRAYEELCKKELLIDYRHESENVAIKYSCFDGEYGNWMNSK
ncbi:DUF3800 domain-containing protein [Phaeobacter gallaeciensis]|uniref:DUF3800 domain-containing protein n=1 Tax=Phaeobacter gallaeciensis TaxID=60890 RepID=A0A366X3M9_9RHOB|nr:DUF3800 domain-containing protein [Phaeobacter gallaeciensis]RBW57608.1 DUF3800 domain-containing protein [Phaeobacter gallaeciensis]